MPMRSEQMLQARIRGEYREMPGLRLTVAQACKLWQIDREECLGLLEQLVTEGVLYRRSDGAYCAFPAIRPRPVKAERVDVAHTVRRNA
jgi:hypothetical protein